VADIFGPILTKFGFAGQIFTQVPNIEFHGNASSGSYADTCGRTDMTKVIDVFGDYANAPKNVTVVIVKA
jgi:hypothetical protein